MSFSIENEKSLKACNKVCYKISNIKQKGFDSKPVYNEKKFKNKIKPYYDKINTNFHDNRMPKEGYHLSVMLLDSVFKKGKNYYP